MTLPSPTIIATSRTGMHLLEFIPQSAALPAPASPDPAIPLVFTQVVVVHEGRTLLIFNSERDQWEVPGGGLEPGETVDACAVRELLEETGQAAAAVCFRALFKIRTTDARYEYGALYTATLDAPREFVPNAEVARIHWWDGSEALEGGPLSAFSRAFMDFCRS